MKMPKIEEPYVIQCCNCGHKTHSNTKTALCLRCKVETNSYVKQYRMYEVIKVGYWRNEVK